MNDLILCSFFLEQMNFVLVNHCTDSLRLTHHPAIWFFKVFALHAMRPRAVA